MLRRPPHHHAALLDATRAAVLTAALVLVPLGPGTGPLPAPPGPAPTASSRWAPADEATITPGVQMDTRGAQCSGNFVFTDARRRVYVGYAAHCAGLGEATDVDGCRSRSLPPGTRVRFAENMSLAAAGTTRGYGRLAWSSWTSMRRRALAGGPLCEHNDFALVRVEAPYVGRVNPSVPWWGGPSRLGPGRLARGGEVFGYGSSGLRAGLSPLGPKAGASLGQSGGGWRHDVYTATPGVPGDSGAGYLDAQGRAFGVLSTVQVTPLPGSNGIGDLHREVRYAQRWSGIPGLRLVPGTRPFSPVPRPSP
jgi:hypothetical protein